MSNLDDNIEIIEEQGSGFAGFRAFEYDPATQVLACVP